MKSVHESPSSLDFSFPMGQAPSSVDEPPIYLSIDRWLFKLFIAVLISIAGIADFYVFGGNNGNGGCFFGSSFLFFVPFGVWLAILTIGWKYARESVGISYGVRFLWIGLLVGAAVSALAWGVVITPLRDQYYVWPLDGTLFTRAQAAQFTIVNGVALPLFEQLLVAAVVVYATSGDRARSLWRPYSFVYIAVHIEIGVFIAEHIIQYSIFPAWFIRSASSPLYSDVCQAVFGESLMFVFTFSPTFALAGALLGVTRAIHQLPHQEQLRAAASADVPPFLFPSRVIALMVLLTVIRCYPEIIRAVLLSQETGVSVTTKVLVHGLVPIATIMRLRSCALATFPTLFKLDSVNAANSA